jgi:hypothetical protein
LNNPLRLVDLDAEETEYIQKGLLDMIADELDDDEKASSSSSESGDEEDPNETNIALLDKNSQSIRTEQVNRKFFYEGPNNHHLTGVLARVHLVGHYGTTHSLLGTLQTNEIIR